MRASSFSICELASDDEAELGLFSGLMGADHSVESVLIGEVEGVVAGFDGSGSRYFVDVFGRVWSAGTAPLTLRAVWTVNRCTRLPSPFAPSHDNYAASR